MDISFGLGLVSAAALAIWTIMLAAAQQMMAQRKWEAARTLYWGSLLPILLGDCWVMAFANLNWGWRISISGVIGATALIAASEGVRGVAYSQSPSASSERERPNANVSDIPAVTGTGTTVISIGQTGGVTAGTYINQAVAPELRVISRLGQQSPDGTYTTTMELQIVSPITPGNLAIQVQADGLLDAGIAAAPRNGVSMTSLRNVMRTRDSYSADIPSPYGNYTLNVKTRTETPINLDSHF